MFGNDWLNRVPAGRREEILRHVEATLRPVLCPNGQWFADYRRLRVVARKADAPR